jgi:hypothetical protein
MPDLASSVDSIRLEDRHSNRSNTKSSWYARERAVD